MKIINITAMWLFLFMFLLPTMTMADSAYSTEEKKERVILKSELEELRVLLDKIDAQIIMAKKRKYIRHTTFRTKVILKLFLNLG